MKNIVTIITLSALTVTSAQAVSFDPKTGKVQRTQQEINAHNDKVGVDNWAYANQANGTAKSALYFANKNHADIKNLKADYKDFTNTQEIFNHTATESLEDASRGIAGNKASIATMQSDVEDLNIHVDQTANAQDKKISNLETTVVRKPDLDKETALRVKNDNATNRRVDKLRARTADTNRQNAHQQIWITKVQTKADRADSKVPVFEKGIREAHGRIDGLDVKTDIINTTVNQHGDQINALNGQQAATTDRLNDVTTTVSDHGGRIGGLESTQAIHNDRLNDHEARITTNSQNISTLDNRTTDLQAEVDTKASKASVSQVERNLNTTNRQVNTNTANIERTSHTAGQALEVGNTAYHNTQVNAHNIDAVDRASIERSKAAVFESNAYTDATKAELEQRMNRQYDKVRKEAFAGVASVAAMANMPFLQGKGTSIAVGTGFYKDASAAALGLQYQPSEDDVFRVSGSITNGGDGAFGAGFSHRM